MKKELIDRIVEREEHEHFTLKQILEEELPDFQRIDEERFLRIYRRNYTINIDDAIKEYNSTLPPALKPLPKEMPEWFHGGHNFYKLWSLVCHNYGTESNLQPLPSVEELHTEINQIWNSQGANLLTVTKHLHSKYGTQPREWWQDLKEGDKFMFEGKVRRFQRFVLESRDRYCGLSDCTPYTPPSAQDIIAEHNLSEEEVKILREGKV